MNVQYIIYSAVFLHFVNSATLFHYFAELTYFQSLDSTNTNSKHNLSFPVNIKGTQQFFSLSLKEYSTAFMSPDWSFSCASTCEILTKATARDSPSSVSKTGRTVSHSFSIFSKKITPVSQEGNSGEETCIKRLIRDVRDKQT